MPRFSLLALLTAVSWCIEVGAQDVVIAERHELEEGEVQKCHHGPLQGFPPEIDLGDGLSISSQKLILIHFHGPAKGPKNVRALATVLFETPDGKSVVRKQAWVGYYDKDGKLTALTFKIATDLGNQTFLPAMIELVDFRPTKTKNSTTTCTTTAKPKPPVPPPPVPTPTDPKPKNLKAACEKAASPAGQAAPVEEKRAPLVQAFDKLPRITPVPEYMRADSTAGGKDMDDDWMRVKKGANCPVDFRFGTAAHFPIPQFGSPHGEMLESSALVIYEGMRLLIFPDGHYEVHFTATTPDIPVTLRLQFVVASSNLFEPFTITLPPIAIDGEVTARGNYRGRTVQVRHVGNSHLVRAASDAWLGQVPPLLIIRQGVARFGTLPVTN